jgi:O-antigen ligase
MSLFALCLLVFRTRGDVDRAFRAVALAGVVVLGVTAFQLLVPGLALPGMVAAVGTVQSNELLPQANLRVGGPLGDYELLAELASLVGIVAFFLSLRTAGARSAAWLGLLLACLVGIGTTSTRSGFITVLLGVLALALFLTRNRGKILAALAGVALLGTIAIPLLHALQSRFDTGFLLERLLATPTDQGLVRMLDRASLWPYFTDRLRGGADLFLGRGVAFDLDSWGTYPHSLPLTLVVTVGLVGALAFFGLLAAIAWRCLSAWRRTGDPYPVLGLVLVAMFAIHELKIEYLRVTSYTWFVWALLGICAASAAVARGEES